MQTVRSDRSSYDSAMKWFSSLILVITGVVAYFSVFVGIHVADSSGNNLVGFGVAAGLLLLSGTIGGIEIRRRNRDST